MMAWKNLHSGSQKFPTVAQWASDQLVRNVNVAAVEFSVSMLPLANGLIQLCDIDLTTIPTTSASRLSRWQTMWSHPSLMWTDGLAACDAETAELLSELVTFVKQGGATHVVKRAVHISVNHLAGMTKIQRQKIGRLIWRYNRRSAERLLRDIDRLVAGDQDESLSGPDWDLVDPFHFLAKVRIPCFAQFGLPPDQLYRLAIEGERQSLERTLMLDPTVELMPEIREISINHLLQGKPISHHQFKRVHKVGLTRTSCKALAISWCREWSRLIVALNSPELRKLWKFAFGFDGGTSRELSIPDLRGLFDAYAQDHGQLIDADLQADGDALRKMVVRLSKSFPLRAWDIFSSSNVPMK